MWDNKIASILCILLLSFTWVLANRRDHGFGYLFKHDPNLHEREKAERATKDMIRTTLTMNENGTLTMFPEPFLLNDIETKFSGTTMQFTGMRVYGLDRYRPFNIKTDYTNLAVSLDLSLAEVYVLGDFQMTPWVADANGDFKFTINDLSLSLRAELAINNEGAIKETLVAHDVKILEAHYDELHLKLGNLGFLGAILKPIQNSLAKYIFQQVKPILISEAENNFRQILNHVLSQLPKECPKAVNLVDRAIIRARKLMKTSELDPLFLVDQYPRSTPLVTLELTQGKLFGLAGLKRTGPIFVGFERDAVYMLLNLGIENVKGQYGWTLTLWKNLLTQHGILDFNVEDMAVAVKLEKLTNSQDSKTRVESLEMKIGTVSIRSKGTGTLKYIMETFLNVVPDSFRQKIKDAAHYRLLQLIEKEVEKIDLEEIVEDSKEARRRRR